MATPEQAQNSRETRLWYWLLFESPLSTLRAKRCLSRWLGQGLSVSAALDRLPGGYQALGLTREEARQLDPPPSLPDVRALRWNAPHYPDGLRELPLKRRPALLFVRGNPGLLARPIVTFVPGQPNDEEMAMLREAMSVLLGEDLLLAALAGSVQAALLLEEMAYSDGEILLVPTAGLDRYQPSEMETRTLDAGRLVLATPLPPAMPANPKLEPLLQQILSAAAARRILGAAAGGYDAGEPPRPTLALTPAPPSGAASPHLQCTDNASDVLLWVQHPDQDLRRGPLASVQADETQASPLSPEQTLNLLEQGGDVPPALRARLTETEE
jgi:hypothetical protein